MNLLSYDQGILKFDNGTTIEDIHEQDCCEHVYADWEQLKDTDVLNHEFPEEIGKAIEGVEGAGIKIDGYFIPCYNSQNGYYSSDLEIWVKYPDKRKVVIDVTEFVEDQID